MSSRLPRDKALEKESKKISNDQELSWDKRDEKTKQNKTKKKKQPRPAPAASTAGPCPTICQSSRTPRHWKLLSTIVKILILSDLDLGQ